MFSPVLAEWIAADQVAARQAEAEAWRRARALRPARSRGVGMSARMRRSVTAWRVSLGLLGGPSAVGCETS